MKQTSASASPAPSRLLFALPFILSSVSTPVKRVLKVSLTPSPGGGGRGGGGAASIPGSFVLPSRPLLDPPLCLSPWLRDCPRPRPPRLPARPPPGSSL
jgi:hypothetical protein